MCVCVCGVKSGSEWLSTEQPVRHNTGHQQSLPHTGYQHGTALGTRSVLQETSSKPGSGQSERRFLTTYLWGTWLPLLCLARYGRVCAGFVSISPATSLNLAWCVRGRDLPTSFWSSWREDLIRSRRAVSCFFSSSWVCLIWGEQMRGWGEDTRTELRDYQLCLHGAIYCTIKNASCGYLDWNQLLNSQIHLQTSLYFHFRKHTFSVLIVPLGRYFLTSYLSH